MYVLFSFFTGFILPLTLLTSQIFLIGGIGKQEIKKKKSPKLHKMVVQQNSTDCGTHTWIGCHETHKATSWETFQRKYV